GNMIEPGCEREPETTTGGKRRLGTGLSARLVRQCGIVRVGLAGRDLADAKDQPGGCRSVVDAAEERLLLLGGPTQSAKPPAHHAADGRNADLWLIPVGTTAEAGCQQLDVSLPVHVRFTPLVFNHSMTFLPCLPWFASAAARRGAKVASRSNPAFTVATFPSREPGFIKAVM